MKKISILLLIVFTALLLNSCKTQRAGQGSVMPKTQAALLEHLSEKIQKNAAENPYRTARLNLSLESNGKNIKVGGSLKMKHDDVILLSLTFLGFEVARFEFTPHEVLLLDRVHRQYMRSDYSQVRFLRESGLNFYSLQSLFWNELFYPHEHAMTMRQRCSVRMMRRWDVSTAGDHTLLTLRDAPKVDYLFLLHTNSGIIDRITLRSKHHAEMYTTWRYTNFKDLDGRPVPSEIDITVSTGKKEAKAMMHLSSIGQKNNWNTRTKVSEKYTERQLEEISNLISGLLQ